MTDTEPSTPRQEAPEEARAKTNTRFRPSPEGTAACRQWLHMDVAQRHSRAGLELLLIGLKGSPIEEAAIRYDPTDRTPMIAFWPPGTPPGSRWPWKACWLDPEVFCYLRLLLASGRGSLRANDDGNGLAYLKLRLPRSWRTYKKRRSLPMDVRRLSADVGRDQEAWLVNPAADHDLRRRNLYIKGNVYPSYGDPKKQQIKTDRSEMESAAVKNCIRDRTRLAKAGFKLSGAEFKRLLKAATGLIDNLPLGRAQVTEAAE